MLNSQKVNQTRCNVYIAHLYSDIFTCLWYMMICDDIWWYIMIYGEIWWYIMIYDDIWWYMMTYDDIWRKQKQQHTFCIYIYITILYETTIKNIKFYICPMYIYIYNVRICLARGSPSNVHYVPSISNYVRKNVRFMINTRNQNHWLSHWSG